MDSAARREVFHFKKVNNFRDIGGLRTEDGRMMKLGVLYRSDEPSKLTVKEIEKLLKLDIKLICDLRTLYERKSKVIPLKEDQLVKVFNIPISQNEQDYTHIDFFKLMVKEAKSFDFEQMMQEFYYRIAFESKDQIREVMTLLANDANRPALIHCTGGKDRTGTIAALIQLLVGVPREEVVADYMRSNQYIEARMSKMMTFLRFMSLFQVSRDQLQPMMEVRASYLDHILDEILERYQSIEHYLQTCCGVREETIDHLKKELVADLE